jgi:hypothetical protein
MKLAAVETVSKAAKKNNIAWAKMCSSDNSTSLREGSIWDSSTAAKPSRLSPPDSGFSFPLRAFHQQMDQIRAHDSFSFSLLYVIFDYPSEELSGTFRKHLDPKQLKIIFNYLVARSSSTYISDALGHLRHYDLDSLPRRELCQDDPHREKTRCWAL